jgi:hypothetical protein
MAIISDSYLIEIITRDCDFNKAGPSVDGIVNELLDHVARSCDDNRRAKNTNCGLRES